jgi:hypothetical protein
LDNVTEDGNKKYFVVAFEPVALVEEAFMLVEARTVVPLESYNCKLVLAVDCSLIHPPLTLTGKGKLKARAISLGVEVAV